MSELTDHLAKMVLGGVALLRDFGLRDTVAGIDGTGHQYAHREICSNG
jgi:hypothetical protein